MYLLNADLKAVNIYAINFWHWHLRDFFFLCFWYRKPVNVDCDCISRESSSSQHKNTHWIYSTNIKFDLNTWKPVFSGIQTDIGMSRWLRQGRKQVWLERVVCFLLLLVLNWDNNWINMKMGTHSDAAFLQQHPRAYVLRRNRRRPKERGRGFKAHLASLSDVRVSAERITSET